MNKFDIPPILFGMSLGACIFAFATFAFFHLMNHYGKMDNEGVWGWFQFGSTLFTVLLVLLSFWRLD
jgi:hypothetical protein